MNRGVSRYAPLAIALCLCAADPALAQSGGAANATTFFQNIVNMLTGTLGQVIAVCALALGGIAIAFGVPIFRAVGGVIVGIIVIFSAQWAVNTITGGGG